MGWASLDVGALQTFSLWGHSVLMPCNLFGVAHGLDFTTALESGLALGLGQE